MDEDLNYDSDVTVAYYMDTDWDQGSAAEEADLTELNLDWEEAPAFDSIGDQLEMTIRDEEASTSEEEVVITQGSVFNSVATVPAPVPEEPQYAEIVKWRKRSHNDVIPGHDLLQIPVQPPASYQDCFTCEPSIYNTLQQKPHFYPCDMASLPVELSAYANLCLSSTVYPQPSQSLVYPSGSLVPIPFPYQLHPSHTFPVFTSRLSMPSSYPNPASLYHSTLGASEIPTQLPYPYGAAQAANGNPQFIRNQPQTNPFLHYGSIHV